MALDMNKLENVEEEADGKITARCPACAENFADRKGEHLVIYPNGKFGCAANPEDAAHRKRIYALAGDGQKYAHVPVKITVNAFVAPESTVVLDLGKYTRFSTGLKKSREAPPADAATPFQEVIPVVDVQVQVQVQVEGPPPDRGPRKVDWEHPEKPRSISEFNVPKRSDLYPMAGR